MPSDKRKKSSTASSSSSAYSPPTGEDAAERSRPGVRRRVSSSSHIRSASASPSRAAAAAGGHEQSVPIVLEAGDTGAGNKNRSTSTSTLYVNGHTGSTSTSAAPGVLVTTSSGRSGHRSGRRSLSSQLGSSLNSMASAATASFGSAGSSSSSSKIVRTSRRVQHRVRSYSTEGAQNENDPLSTRPLPPTPGIGEERNLTQVHIEVNGGSHGHGYGGSHGHGYGGHHYSGGSCGVDEIDQPPPLPRPPYYATNKPYNFELSGDLWLHALTCLDRYRSEDPSQTLREFYSFHDETGILERHRRMMEHSFERGNVSLKEMYLELIKLMLDREERVWPEGYPKTRDIHRLQSFQELTNRLQRILNGKFIANDKQLAFKIESLHREIEEVEKRLSLSFTDNNTVVNHSERIGKLEQAIEILVEREARTGKDLESLHSHNRDLRRKVSDLEQADSFLREANRDLTSRVERLESEQNKFGNLLVKFEVDLGATHGIRELIEELRRDHQSAWSRAETFFSALKNLEHRLDNFHDGRTNELFEQFRSLQTLVGGFEMRICQTERDGKTLVDLLNALDGKVNLFESDKHGLEIMIRKDFESRFGDFQKTIDIKILDLGGKYDHYDQHLHGLGSDIADFKRAINELREEFGSSKYNLNEIRSQFHSLSQKIELLRSFEQFMDEMKGSHDTMNTRIVSLTMEIKNLDSKHGSVHNSLRQGLAELKDRMKSDLKELDISLKLHLERDVKSLGQKIRDLEEKEFMILKAMLLDKLRDSDSERKVILAKFDGLEKDFLIWKKEPVRNIHDSVITSICNDIQSRVEKIIQVGDVDVKKWVKCLEKELRALEKEFGKLPDYSKDITVLKEIKRENDGIRGEQKNMNMRINTNGHDIRSQNKRIDQLEKQDEMLKKRVDSVEARTSRDHDKIESLENGMEHHQKKVEVKITKNEVRIHKQGKEIDDKLDNLRRGIFDQVMKILEEMKVGIMIEVKDISFDDTLFNAFKGDIEKQLCGQSGEISSLKRLVRDNIEKLIVVKELITQVKSNKESIEDLKRLKPRLERLTKDLESLRDNTNIRMQKLESGFRKESDKQGDLNAKVREDLRALERALNKFISDINQDIHMIENKSKELVHVEVNQWNAQITRNFEESNRDLEERLARRIVEIHDFFTKNEVEIGRLRDWNQSRCEDLKRMIEDRFGGQGQFNEAIEKELNVSIEKIRVDIEASIKRIEQQIGNNEEIDGVKNAWKTLRESMGIMDNDFRINLREIKDRLSQLDQDQSAGNSERNSLVRSVTQLRDLYTSMSTDFKEDFEKRISLVIKDQDQFGHDVRNQKLNIWRLILQMYNTMRGFTVVLKSSGPATRHQPSCLGVYRMVDHHDGRPAYRQDEGDHYLYYNERHDSWMVGSRIGHHFAWIKNSSCGQRCHEDSAPAGMLLLPDLREGWEYQELEREGDMSSNWHKDDHTLHAEVLTGVDIIRDSIEEMGDFEQDSFMHGFSLSNASTAKQIRPMGSRKSISSSSWNKKAGDYDEDETKKKDEVKSAVSSRGSSSSISKRDGGGESATTKELKAIRAQRVASKQMVVQQSSSTSASSSRVTSRRTVVQKEV